MNKEKFLRILKRKLRSLPKEERESAISFYEDYFLEAESEEIALAKLQDPKEIAANLLIEFGEKNKPLSKTAIILAVVTAPVTLPLGIAGFACIFALIITLIAVIISLFAIVISIFIFGMVSLIVIVPAFIYNLQTGFIYLGITLITLPLAYFLSLFCILATKKFLLLIKNATMKLLKRRYKNEE